ncbi:MULTISPECIES: hypothetical protein [Okeania]|uniref:hypothetical protein n=1 Tax=Okeania TaxID=1458928 RepID=UPI001374D440|nr:MULTISPECIES: hypothetical protein [Okeania]NET77675.1 hypothetical protein [Okeania sp. SIO1F9]
MQRLKKELWGDKLLADAEKLLENPQIKILLSQIVEEERSKKKEARRKNGWELKPQPIINTL